MDVRVALIIAAIVGAIATVTVALIAFHARGSAARIHLDATLAPSTPLAAHRIPNAFVTIFRAFVWVLIGLSYFLAFSGLTGASFSIGVVAVRAFASHAVSLTDSFVPQFAVLSAFGFFCGSALRTVLGLLPRANQDLSGHPLPVLQTEAR
jgi:hypothetical protein